MKSRKNVFIRIKDKIVALFKRRNPMEIFIFFMAISLGIYAIGSLIYFLCGADLWSSVFLYRGKTAFSDFFNSVRDAYQGVEGYTERKIIYPPLSNIIFLFFSLFFKEEYLNSSFTNRNSLSDLTLWQNYSSAIWAISIFTLVGVLLLFWVLWANLGKKNKTSVLFLIFALFTMPVIYAVERGNVLLYAMSALFYFLFNYKSQNKFKKEIALICLAISINIKIYPIVFGLFLLQNKQYKEALRCLLYVVILFVLPSLFFGGPKCLIYMFENIKSFSTFTEMSLISQILNYAVYPVIVLLAGYFVYLLIKNKMQLWKLSAFAIVIILVNPSTHMMYLWTAILVSLVLFVKEEKLKCINVLYFVFLILPLLIYPNFYIPKFYQTQPSPLLMNVVVVASQVGIFILTLVENFSKKYKRYLERQNSKEDCCDITEDKSEFLSKTSEN